MGIARAVPIACAAAPIASPLAILLSTPIFLRMNGPATPPKMPTRITTTAVRAGMPPDCAETFSAMAVVTDLGSSDAMTACSAPIARAISATLRMPTALPVTIAVTIAITLPLICEICSWSR